MAHFALGVLASKTPVRLIGLYRVSACLQPWYSALEAMRYLLPDDQAREKLAGQSWQVGVRLACALASFFECQLALLHLHAVALDGCQYTQASIRMLCKQLCVLRCWQAVFGVDGGRMGDVAPPAVMLMLLQVKLLRQADRTVELLEVDEAKFADELTAQQKDFAATLNTLTTVRIGYGEWCYAL